MADRNSPLTAVLHHLIIKKVGVLDNDFISYLWLIAVAVLQDRSCNTHYEPDMRIDTKNDLQMIQDFVILQIFSEKKCQTVCLSRAM